MMIAAATFMISGDAAATIENVIIGGEIVVYIFLALCCIRCIIYRDLLRAHGGQTDPDFKNYLKGIREDVIRSGMILNFALRWTFFVTFLFMLSAIVHVIL